MKSHRKVIFGLQVFGLAGFGFGFPSIVTLLVEVYPSAIGPARGKSITIDNAVKPFWPEVSVQTLQGKLNTLFQKVDGRALVVMKDGIPEFEHFSDDYSAKTKFNSFSMVKSLVGALILKAVADGKIASLDETFQEVLMKSSAHSFRKHDCGAFWWEPSVASFNTL